MNTRPRYITCWSCSRKLQGRHHALITTPGGEVTVHVACAEEMERNGEGWSVRR